MMRATFMILLLLSKNTPFPAWVVFMHTSIILNVFTHQRMSSSYFKVKSIIYIHAQSPFCCLAPLLTTNMFSLSLTFQTFNTLYLFDFGGVGGFPIEFEGTLFGQL